MHPKVSQKEKKVIECVQRTLGSIIRCPSRVERQKAKFAIDSCGGPAVCALLNIEYIQARVIYIYIYIYIRIRSQYKWT